MYLLYSPCCSYLPPLIGLKKVFQNDLERNNFFTSWDMNTTREGHSTATTGESNPGFRLLLFTWKCKSPSHISRYDSTFFEIIGWFRDYSNLLLDRISWVFSQRKGVLMLCRLRKTSDDITCRCRRMNCKNNVEINIKPEQTELNKWKENNTLSTNLVIRELKWFYSGIWRWDNFNTTNVLFLMSFVLI